MLNVVRLSALFTARPLAAAAATLFLATPHCVVATSTLSASGEVAPTKPLSPAAPRATASPASSDSRTVVFVGDRPAVGGFITRPAAAVDLTTAASTLLKATVVDKTQPGATLESVQNRTAEIVAMRPDVVLLFAGPPEKLAEDPDDQQGYRIQSFARALTAGGTQVFVLPASTGVGAAQAAVLRINASGAGEHVHYVDLGSELAGRPFEEALESIGKTLAAAPPPQPEPPAATATASREPQPEATPETVLPPALTSEADREHVSGENTQQTPAPDASGMVRLSGREVTSATIQMRPPEPLKSFSPRRPAPNKPNEKKQPSFAR